MMEESNDEQPEMVSHEEAVLAEKEAQLSSPDKNGDSGSSQPGTPQISAPSPLPAFLSQKTEPVTPQKVPSTPLATTPSVVSISSKTPVLSPPSFPSSAKPKEQNTPSQNAPGALEIPHEGKRMVEVPVNDPPSGQGQSAQGGGGSGGSLFGWFAGNSLVNKMVEKTKSSMESVITTLDPGMREILHSGGDITVAVTSSKDTKVESVREAFQWVFGRATVNGKPSQSSTAAQPVGYTAGLKSAEERISNLRKAGSLVEGEVVVSVEGFIVEVLPDKWYEMSCLVLKDFSHGIDVQTFSQPTFIPSQYVMLAQDRTAADYPLRWAGLSTTIGEVIESKLPHVGHADWHTVFSGVSRRQTLVLAAQALAHMYKEKLPTSFVS